MKEFMGLVCERIYGLGIILFFGEYELNYLVFYRNALLGIA
jgi:hypothetical protein